MQPHDHTARNAVNGIIADLFKSIVLWRHMNRNCSAQSFLFDGLWP